jgi:1-acyl-sn-glycerol-3-phosphate acyltransferase
MAIYFKKIEISGVDLIPRDGPVILAANHPQSVTDALVLGLRSGRMVHYLAHSGLFGKKWRAWLLRNLGVIPVYRRQDVGDATDRNMDMFAACETLLERGGAIGIFPEGVSAEQRRVQKLKTGAARIALQTDAKNDWRMGVTIVPVGLNFESRRRMRTRVLLRFGQPIAAADYREAYEEDPIEAVYALTDTLQTALRALVVNIERPRFEELVSDIEHIYKGELIERGEAAIPGESRFERDQLVSREISDALSFFLDRDPEMVWRISNLLEDYHRKLDRLRLRDEMLRERKERTLQREATGLLVMGVLGLPLALYGTLWNFVPYKLTGWLARRSAKDSTTIHYNQMIQGAFFYLFYYGVLFYVAYRLLGPTGAVIFGVTVPPTGIFAHAYTRYMVHRQRMLRFALFRLTHRYYLQKIKQQRALVIDEMDKARDKYLAERHIARGSDTDTTGGLR